MTCESGDLPGHEETSTGGVSGGRLHALSG